MSIDRWTDKEDVVFIYNGILFRHKKELNLAICNNMKGPGGYYAKWNMSDRESKIPYSLIYLCNLQNKTNEQT